MNRTELREKLNKIDCENCNKYDLVNLFESVKLSNEDLNKLSEMVEDKDIHDFLYERCYIAEEDEFDEKVEKLLEEENTAKIEIRKEYSWYNVYINNTMILKHISKEDVDDIIDVLEKNNHPYIYKETESSRWTDGRRKAKETVEESMSSAVDRQTNGYKKTKGQIQCNGGEQAKEVEDLLKAKYDNVTTQKGKGGKVIIKFSKNESLKEYAPLEKRKPYRVFVVGDRVKYVNNDGWTKAGESDIGRTGTIEDSNFIGELELFSIKADDHRVDKWGYADDSFIATPNNLEFADESLSKNEKLEEGFSKDDIEWLKSHKGEKLNKGKYKVDYQEYFDNDNNPIGGRFTLYKRAGKYGYDRYAFKNEDELIAYIKRHFFDESLSEDTDPKSARRERMDKFHKVFDSFGECTSDDYYKAFDLFYDASLIDVVDHASKLKSEYDGQKVKYRFTVYSDDYKNSADIHYDPYQNYIGVVVDNNKVDEDTVKQGSQWVNKGKEGTHGKFKTKKEADAQRKAMFARGFKEGVKESLEDVWDNASLSGDSVSYEGHEIYRTPYGYQVTFDNGEEIEFADDREAMEYIDSLNEDVNNFPDDYVLLDSRARNHTDKDIDLYYDCIKEFCMIDEIVYDDMEVTFITNQRDADDWDEEIFKTDYTYTPDEESALECANDYLVKKYPDKITVGDIKKSADDVYKEVKDYFYEQAQREAEEEFTLSDFQEQLKEDKAKETMKSVVAKWRSRRSNKE